MTNMVERIKTEIIKRTNNGTKECTLTMKYDGNEIIIHPCSYGDTNDINDVEYWLVYGPHPWVSGETLDKVAEYLANYEDYCNRQSKEKEELRAYYNKYFAGKSNDQIRREQSEPHDIIDSRINSGINDEELYKDLPDYGDWSWYSDWHKDVYGYRPDREPGSHR